MVTNLDSVMSWFVLYTKSRNEKLVAERLRGMGINVYCPLRRTKRKWSDRFKWVEEPLFRSYVFVQLAEAERNSVFGVPGVVRYLYWLQKPAIVRDNEIIEIRRLLNDYDNEHIQVMNLSPGDRLTIGSGLFLDKTGEVINSRGKIATVVLDTLQVVIKVDLSKTLVTF